MPRGIMCSSLNRSKEVSRSGAFRRTLLSLILLLAATLCTACTDAPSGVTGRIIVQTPIDSPDYSALQIHVVALAAQDAVSSTQVFVEGETVATLEVGPKGKFEAYLRPGDYLLKVKADEQLLGSRIAQVKRHRMTRVNIELKSLPSQESK